MLSRTISQRIFGLHNAYAGERQGWYSSLSGTTLSLVFHSANLYIAISLSNALLDLWKRMCCGPVAASFVSLILGNCHHHLCSNKLLQRRAGWLIPFMGKRFASIPGNTLTRALAPYDGFSAIIDCRCPALSCVCHWFAGPRPGWKLVAPRGIVHVAGRPRS
jgi:hypothetical protein